MTFEEWLVFMGVWIAASVPMGPNAVNCMASAAAGGLRAGGWSVLGVFIAALIHMTAALTGLAAFMAAHPMLFEAVRWAGVAYLVWMGISLLRARRAIELPENGTGRSAPFSLIRRAILISLSNPKAIFAWMAVFSQFVDTTAPIADQIMVLAPSSLGVTLLVYGGYALGGVPIRRFLAGPGARWFDRIAGVTYLGFAAGLATGDLRR